mgnify:FL=1
MTAMPFHESSKSHPWLNKGSAFLNFKVCTSLPFRMVTISLRPIFLSVRMGATG